MSSSYLLKLTGGLILVVAVIFVLAWLVKKMNLTPQSQAGLITVIAGLNLGQKVLADKLAGHLSEKYGVDPQVVQQKVDSLIFDWNTFDPVTCTVGNN